MKNETQTMSQYEKQFDNIRKNISDLHSDFRDIVRRNDERKNMMDLDDELRLELQRSIN